MKMTQRKLKELKTAKAITWLLLETDLRTRTDDHYLYAQVISILRPEISRMSVSEFLTDFPNLRLPSIETVGRARRKLQELYPHLAGPTMVQEGRAENEAVFEAFARNEV